MTTLNKIISVKGFKNHSGRTVQDSSEKVIKSMFHAAVANHRRNKRPKQARVQFQKVRTGARFKYQGMTCVKLGNYGAVDVKTGKDVIPSLFDYVLITLGG